MPSRSAPTAAELALWLACGGALDPASRVEALVELERHRARIDALQAQLLADIVAADTSAEQWCREEVGAALRLSPNVALARIRAAEQLVRRLPDVHEELAAGRVRSDQARVIVEGSFRVPDEALDSFAEHVLADVAGEDLSVGETRGRVRRAVLVADPDGAGRRHRRAVGERHVRLIDADDGMAWLSAFLPAVDAVACYSVLDEAARGSGVPGATLDQLRADSLVGALCGAGQAPPSSGEGSGGGGTAGPTPSVSVVVAASTLLGSDEEPGWLDGYGPIPAEVARSVAHDPSGTWRRIVIDPMSGALLDVGTTRYRPPPAIRTHVEQRDHTCRFPHCSHSARHSDLDHVRPYPNGPTSIANLVAASRRHHRAKTRAGWQLRLNADESATWTSPLGRRYTTWPQRRWRPPRPPVDGTPSGEGESPG